jgi:hypothetical protein
MTKYFLVVATILFISCSQVLVVHELEIQKMPTSYVFNTSKDSLMNAIKRRFVKRITREQETYGWVPHVITRQDLEKVNAFDYYAFADEDSVNNYTDGRMDIKTRHITDSVLQDAFVFEPIGISYNYVFEDTHIRPVYCTSFKLRIKKLNTNMFKVTVYTIDPRIAIGSHISFKDPSNWGGRIATMEPAEPSTIEEYQILLGIGEALGVKDQMPPLVLPSY